MNIELRHYHHQCGDGCCDIYGYDIYIDGELKGSTRTETVDDVVLKVLEALNIEAEVEQTFEDEL